VIDTHLNAYLPQIIDDSADIYFGVEFVGKSVIRATKTTIWPSVG
jgi:hypothetical protein